MKNNQILIVDDEADYRSILSQYLKNYKLIEATRGQEALNLLKKHNSIDLILLDVVMPGMLGTETLKKIKTIAPSVKVIILTSHSSKDVAIESLRNRADYYLEKLASSAELIAVVDKLLKEKNEADGNILAGPDDNVARTIRFIERNYNKRISLEDAAAEVCLSSKYLSRLFIERVGISFRDYLVKTKIKNAREMLQYTSFSVKQISSELGYENPESFIRAFLRLTKKTPSRYRSFSSGWKKVNN